jgi:hypothetical protein
MEFQGDISIAGFLDDLDILFQISFFVVFNDVHDNHLALPQSNKKKSTHI